MSTAWGQAGRVGAECLDLLICRVRMCVAVVEVQGCFYNGNGTQIVVCAPVGMVHIVVCAPVGMVQIVVCAPVGMVQVVVCDPAGMVQIGVCPFYMYIQCVHCVSMDVFVNMTHVLV